MQTAQISEYIQSKNEDFIEEIKRMVKIRHPLADKEGRPTLDIAGARPSMGTQGHNAAVIAKEIDEGRNVLLSGETGSGKTHTVIKSILLADQLENPALPTRILVLCPGQIAKKWANEEVPADDPTARTYIVENAFDLARLMKIEAILDSFSLAKPGNDPVTDAARKTGMDIHEVLKHLRAEIGVSSTENIIAYARKRTRLWIICDEQKLKNTYSWKPAFKSSYFFFMPEREVPKEPALKEHDTMPCARKGCKLHSKDDKNPHHGIMRVNTLRLAPNNPEVSKRYMKIPVCPTCHTAITKWDRGSKSFALMSYSEAMTSKRIPTCIYCKEQMWKAVGTQAYKSAKYITCYREWEEHLSKTLARHRSAPARASVPNDDFKNDMAAFSQSRPPFRDKGKKQISVAEALSRWNYGIIKRAVIDEMHQYKAVSSARGIAAGQVAALAKTVIAMTGTLMGGYSTTLMYIMLRFSGGLYEEYPYGKSESKWIDRFGYHKTKWTEKPQEMYRIGKATKRKNNKQTRESPGITPDLLKMMLSNTVFMNLADVSDNLPTYTEMVLPVEMSEEEDPYSGLSQKRAYHKVESAVVEFVAETIAEGSARGIGLIVTKLRPYASMVEKGIEIYDPQPDANGNRALIVKAPPVRPTEEPDEMWPKEHELVGAVKRNVQAGRKSLIYVENTDKLDITPRIKEVLEKSGVSAGVLKADTVDLRNRGEWLEKNADKWQALICSPKLVEMGMDLNKYGFTNIIWYQMVYSSYTVGQASKRSYRIGQTEDCTVMFMCYDDTVEMNALKLVAQKIQVSEALEGKLNSGEFTTYVDDMNTALARELLDKVKTNQDDIQAALKSQTMAEQDQFIGIEKIIESQPPAYSLQDDAADLFTGEVDEALPDEKIPATIPEPRIPSEEDEREHAKMWSALKNGTMGQDISSNGNSDPDAVPSKSVVDITPAGNNNDEEIQEATGYEKAIRLDMFTWSEKMKTAPSKKAKIATAEQPSLFDSFGA